MQDDIDAAALAETRTRRTVYPLGSGQADELAVLAGLKPVMRKLLDPGGFRAAAGRLEGAGLHVAIADVRYERRPDGCLGVARSVETGYGVLYAGVDPATVREAAACELDVDDAEERLTRELGRRLGYPRCCVEAFASVPRPRGTLDVFAAALTRTSGPPAPRLNGLDMAIFHLVPWIPCSYRCPLSIRYADAVAALVDDRFPGFLAAIDVALGAHRLVVSDDVQVSLRGTLGPGGIAIEEVWPSCIDRDPRATLGEEAARRVARLVTRLRAARTLEVRDGQATADGAPLESRTRFVLAPFGHGAGGHDPGCTTGA